MKYSRKRMEAVFLSDEEPQAKTSELSRCSVCRKRFKSRSRFDYICNLCWADNEMKPYINFGSPRNTGSRGGFVN